MWVLQEVLENIKEWYRYDATYSEIKHFEEWLAILKMLEYDEN